MSASAARVHQTLTNFAAGVGQDLSAPVADFLLPRVIVGAGSYQFKRYNADQSQLIYKTEVAIGGKPTRIEFSADDPASIVKHHALEAVVADQERTNAGDNGKLLEQSKITTLVTNWHVSREDRVLRFVESNTTAESGLGDYTDDTVDPVAEWDAVIRDQSIKTGMIPNRATMDINMWYAIKNHPKVVSRFTSGSSPSSVVTLQGFANLLLNPNIEIRLAGISKSTTKKGATKNAVTVLGAKAYIFYASPNPTQFDASWFKTFSTGAGNVNSVRYYRDEPFNDCYLINMDDDPQLIHSGMGVRIDLQPE